MKVICWPRCNNPIVIRYATGNDSYLLSKSPYSNVECMAILSPQIVQNWLACLVSFVEGYYLVR